MSVIFSSNITLNTDPSVDIANRARLLYDNVFQQGTVTASSEVGADNGWLENAVDGGTYDWWEWTSTPAWLEVTLTTAQPVDMCAIGLHTGLTFVYQYYNGAAWVNMHEPVTTGSTAVHAVIFSEVTASKYRIYISAADDEKILGIVMLGKSLTFPKTFHGGHAPITLNRTTQIVRNKTEAGFDAGVYSLRTGAATSVEIDNIKPNWIRDNLEDLNKKLEICPFIFAWRPSTYPNDVAYCWLNSPITASNNGTRDYMSMRFDVQAFVGGGIVSPVIERLFIGNRLAPYFASYEDNETSLTLTGQQDNITATDICSNIAINSRGIVAAAFFDDGIFTYDYRNDTWTPLDALTDLGAPYHYVDIHPDNARWLVAASVLSCTLHKRITKPDATNQYYYQSGSTPPGRWLGKFSPDGTLFASSGLSLLNVATFDVDTGVFGTADNYTVGQFVRAIAWSADSLYLAAACESDSPRLKIFKRDIADDTFDELTIDLFFSKAIPARTADALNSNCLAWHPDGELLAIGGDDSNPNVYIYQNNGDDTFSDVTAAIIDEQPLLNGRLVAVEWSPTGSRLFVGIGDTANNNLCVYNYTAGQLQKSYTQLIGASANSIGDIKSLRFAGSPTNIPPIITAEVFLYDSMDVLVAEVTQAGTYTIIPTITVDPDIADSFVLMQFYVDDVLIGTVSESPWEFDYEFVAGDDQTTKAIKVDVFDAFGGSTSDTKNYIVDYSWKPSLISTELWLDAADTDTITETGGLVSAWNDKSGNARHFTSNSDPQRPTLSGTNMVFAGAHALTSAATDFPVACTIVAVYRLTSTPSSETGYSIYRLKPTSTTFSEFLPSALTGYQPYSFMGNYLSLGNSTGVNTALTTSRTVLYLQYDGVSNTSTSSYGADIDFTGQTVVSSGDFAAISSDKTSIGARSDSSGALAFRSNAEINEIVCISGSLNLATKQKLEGYLAHKWGLTGLLPGGHPYKSTKPPA